MVEQPVWLIGAGQMARAYAEILRALDTPPLVICRSPASAERFSSETGLRCVHGGLNAALAEERKAPVHAIVAVDVGQLAATTHALLDAGCRHILVEKPGGIDANEIAALAAKAAERGAEVLVAYNRRFYGSVLAARKALEEDGGPVSVFFDFTEASDRVLAVGHPPELLQEWLLANSTHVIDTAFFLAGAPVEWSARVNGALSWHPRAARFAGQGVTDRGALFAYLSDWDAPGRWGIEISSRERRFILKPMEILQVQKRGSFTVEAVEAPDDLDIKFKPGLYVQTCAFLTGSQAELLPTIREHSHRVQTIYEPIAAGSVPASLS